MVLLSFLLFHEPTNRYQRNPGDVGGARNPVLVFDVVDDKLQVVFCSSRDLHSRVSYSRGTCCTAWPAKYLA